MAKVSAHPQHEDHQARWLANVRPPDWKNPVPAEIYSLVVLGAGTAGLTAVRIAAARGIKVALVERQWMGGRRLNGGDVSAKALLRASRAAAAVRQAGAFGIRVSGPVEVDFAAVAERLRQVRARSSWNDSASRYQNLGVDLFFGDGRFVSGQAIEVDGRRLNFKHALIATGSQPVVPAIEGLEAAGYWTTETIFSLEQCPKRLAIIGDSAEAIEFAQAFQRLGSQVTLVLPQGSSWPGEDPEAAAVMRDLLAREGVQVLEQVLVRACQGRGNEKIVQVENRGAEEMICADELLLAAGRRPNMAGLGLDAAGVAWDEQLGVPVDEFMQTQQRHVYAAGSVCRPDPLPIAAEASARAAAQNILRPNSSKYRPWAAPRTIHTDPEIAHVGLTAEHAKNTNRQMDTYRRSLLEVDRAVIDREEGGFIKLHAAKGSDTLLGATLVASAASEIINTIGLALENRIGLEKLSQQLYPYQTHSAADVQGRGAYRQRTLARSQDLSARWLSWLGPFRRGKIRAQPSITR